MSALPKLYRVIERLGFRTEFPDTVRVQVARIVRTPGINDSKLRDLTYLSFVTIDNDDSKDLDQAMCISPADSGGWVIHYALADASYYVSPNTPLFEEAMKRGSSFYFPGFSLPMLPTELSQGLVSLNPNVDRRALVFEMLLDGRGACTDVDIFRARVRSRAKLTYRAVQEYHDHPDASPLANQPYSQTLDLLRTVGELRIQDAVERNIVRYDRSEMRVDLPEVDSKRLRVTSRARMDVERWNEQVSILCNVQGAAFLAKYEDPQLALDGIFRVHEPPEETQIDAFQKSIRTSVLAQALDADRWLWRRSEESLAQYLARLPDEGEGQRLSLAIQRQALLLNQRAEFALEPAGHHGVGAAQYSRFSSPMRELVGVLTHLIAIAQLDADPSGLTRRQVNDALEVADAAKARQKRLSREVLKIAIDDLFEEEIEKAPEQRTVHAGTVMGVTQRRVYVRLDDPPIDVKVYVDELQELTGGRYQVENEGTDLSFRPAGSIFGGIGFGSAPAPGVVARFGARIQFKVAGYNRARDHWQFALIS